MLNIIFNYKFFNTHTHTLSVYKLRAVTIGPETSKLKL